jgi:hypothetical protein
MSGLQKLWREPHKALFYGTLYGIYWFRCATGQDATIVMKGAGHTRPNLTWKIFAYLGLRAVRDGKGPVYYHEDATEVSGCTNAINGRCVDISKSNVGTVFAKVFGYDLDIDPRYYNGPIVRKSETNALHDGIIITGPIPEPETCYVYQKLIDNSQSDGMVIDLRTAVIGSEIPYVYLKYRPKVSRFSNDNAYVKCVNPDKVFSKDEIYLIILFTREIGFDIGELDILRDRETQKIYIVDVAKTPHSPSDNYIGLAVFWRSAAGRRRSGGNFLDNAVGLIDKWHDSFGSN